LTREYCVLEGIGTVANALTVGREHTDIDRFAIHIASRDDEDVEDDEEDHPSFELQQ